MRKPARITAVILRSSVCGSALVGSLYALSCLVSRWFPYRDLPSMPKPLFLYALLPGFLAAGAFDNKWVSIAAFFLANSLVHVAVSRGDPVAAHGWGTGCLFHTMYMILSPTKTLSSRGAQR